MPWKDKLRKLLFLAMLGMGGLFGATMNPKEIEDLMRVMNQTQIEVVVKEESGDGDGRKDKGVALPQLNKKNKEKPG